MVVARNSRRPPVKPALIRGAPAAVLAVRVGESHRQVVEAAIALPRGWLRYVEKARGTARIVIAPGTPTDLDAPAPGVPAAIGWSPNPPGQRKPALLIDSGNRAIRGAGVVAIEGVGEEEVCRPAPRSQAIVQRTTPGIDVQRACLPTLDVERGIRLAERTARQDPVLAGRLQRRTPSLPIAFEVQTLGKSGAVVMGNDVAHVEARIVEGGGGPMRGPRDRPHDGVTSRLHHPKALRHDGGQKAHECPSIVQSGGCVVEVRLMAAADRRRRGAAPVAAAAPADGIAAGADAWRWQPLGAIGESVPADGGT